MAVAQGVEHVLQLSAGRGDDADVPVQVARDEYVIKSWPLDEDPTGKLLAYRKGAAPSCVDNRPLEREPAQGLFSVGRTSLCQNDLGLTWDGVDEVVRVHVAFGVTYMNEGRGA